MSGEMKILVKWVDKGEWEVTLKTRSQVILLGNVDVTAAGDFVALTEDGRKLAPQQRLQQAAAALCGEEIGEQRARAVSVLRPFEDGSGP